VIEFVRFDGALQLPMHFIKACLKTSSLARDLG
jgi:hypothetical protein